MLLLTLLILLFVYIRYAFRSERQANGNKLKLKLFAEIVSEKSDKIGSQTSSDIAEKEVVWKRGDLLGSGSFGQVLIYVF